MRVYEIAKEVGIPNKDLIAKIRALGLEVNNHMSSLDADDVARIRRSLEKEKQAVVQPQQTQRLSQGAVLRRRSSGDKPEVTETHEAVTNDRGHSNDRSNDRGHSNDRAHAVHDRAPERSSDRHIERPADRTSDRHIERPSATSHANNDRAAAPAVERSAPPPTVRRRPVVEDTAAEPAPAAPAAVASAVGSERVEVRPAPVAPVTPPPVAARPAPAPEPEPARVEAEHVEPAPVAAAPTPVAAPPAPTPAAAPVAATEPAEPAPAAEARRSRVILAGPSVIGRAQTDRPVDRGNEPQSTMARAADVTPPPSRPLPARVITRDEPAAPPPMPQGPRTVVEMAGSARDRFEAELQRARSRTVDRPRSETQNGTEPEVAAAPVAAAEAPLPPARDPSRPAVGSVISLPPRIKITERAVPGGARPQTVGAPPANPIRGRYAQQQQKGGRPGGPGGRPGSNDFGRKKLPLGKKGKQTQLTTPAEHKRVIRIEDTISVGDLARGMGTKSTEVLKKLWGMGMTGININASIDFDTAQILSSEFGYEVQNVAFKEQDVFSEKVDEESTLVHRAPVVTVMGHVDHGKTTLLDAIRKTRVAAGESGGITQHVAAYKVPVPGHGDVVFLDTPGHEAFTEMRARGAQATDIVVLVVAANDGVMPQTIEALSHAKDAKVSIIVAVNKIDAPDASPDRVRQQLADKGLIPEEWGGDTIYVNVSALRGENIDKLLESIAVTAEVLDLRAAIDKPASGLVIEARLDRNRGPMATVLIQEGTLKVGDILVAGRTFGKVRAMLDDRGEMLKEAGPSTPIEILGLDGVPDAGDQVNAAEDDKVAKQVVEHRRQQYRKRELASTVRVSLEGMMERLSVNAIKELKIVLKADVQGSAEALKAALVKQSTEKVKVTVISAGVGGITESDVNLAKAGGAIIVGFHVRPAGKSAKLAEQEEVEIKLYDIIYDALDEVKSAMAGLLAPIKREIPLGKLSVRETYSIPKIGTVAGCMVTDGKINRKAHLRIIRDAVQVYEGKVGSLRRFKDDVSEVGNGYECGVMIAGYNDVKAGDVIEAYEVIEEAAQL